MKGAKRSFPLFFGSSPDTEPIGLPVGNLDEHFFNDIVINVMDSVGDFYEFITPVKVCVLLIIDLWF